MKRAFYCTNSEKISQMAMARNDGFLHDLMNDSVIQYGIL